MILPEAKIIYLLLLWLAADTPRPMQCYTSCGSISLAVTAGEDGCISQPAMTAHCAAVYTRTYCIYT